VYLIGTSSHPRKFAGDAQLPVFPRNIFPLSSDKRYDTVRKRCAQVKKHLDDAGAGKIEQLLLDIARVHHWTGLYAPGHPILAGQIDALRASLSGEAHRDPSGMLLLGIARDRVLFRDRFFGGDDPLVSNFTKVLYRRHVATLGIAEDVTAGELAVFFRRLHDLWAGKTDDSLEEFLLREGIRGIRISTVNYKEVLSRGIFATEASPRTEPRQEARGDAPGREFAPPFSEEAIRWRGLAVLVELLLSEKRDPEFLDLLAALEEAIPRLIDERDFELLDRVLSSFLHASESGTPARRAAASDALRSVDFLRIVDAILASPGTLEGEKGGAELLSKHGALAAEALLLKLQVEEGSGRRKILLSLVLRLGEKAVPSILSRIEGQRWFFLRNLCFLLGEIGAPAGIPALVGMLSAKEPKVRREAIQALGKIRMPDPDAIVALGRMLLHQPFFSSSREDPVLIAAAIALSRIGGTEAIAFLHIGKSSKKKAVREQCEALLRTRGTE